MSLLPGRMLSLGEYKQEPFEMHTSVCVCCMILWPLSVKEVLYPFAALVSGNGW